MTDFERKWATASPDEIIADLNEIVRQATMGAFDGNDAARCYTGLTSMTTKQYDRIMRRIRREVHRFHRRERMKRKRRRGWA